MPSQHRNPHPSLCLLSLLVCCPLSKVETSRNLRRKTSRGKRQGYLGLEAQFPGRCRWMWMEKRASTFLTSVAPSLESKREEKRKWKGGFLLVGLEPARDHAPPFHSFLTQVPFVCAFALASTSLPYLPQMDLVMCNALSLSGFRSHISIASLF